MPRYLGLENFYSSSFQDLSVLIIGAVVSGVGRSVVFPAYTYVILTIVGVTTRLSDSKQESYFRDYYQSRFYTGFESILVSENG